MSLQNLLIAPGPAAEDDEPTLDIDGWLIPVTLKRNARAKRFIIRLDPSTRTVTVTLPTHAPAHEALAFARSETAWLRRRLKALPQPVPFAAGETIPFRGDPHVIRHAPERRGVVWTEPAGVMPATIQVSGAPEHLARRVGDWLKRSARADLTARVEAHAASLELTPRKITVRDQSSRWGSCSPSGVLSFSWRLILAPPEVLDYVAAHEVAHLAEMNHGPRFWRLVEQVVPGMKSQRGWLRRHGPDLHRYGIAAL